MILCNCQRFFSAFFFLFCFEFEFRSFSRLEDNVQVLKFVLICDNIYLSLYESFVLVCFFNCLFFNVLTYQNGVFRISPLNTSTAYDGMACRKDAF